MRFQQDGLVYDTDKAQKLFSYNENGVEKTFYRLPSGQCFVAFLMNVKIPTWYGYALRYKQVPWGMRVSERTIQCKAFDLGLDLAALGLPELPEAT